MKVAILGAGRMGQALATQIADNPELTLAGVWVRRVASAEAGGTALLAHADTDLEAILSAADVAVDFTLPDATTHVLDVATRCRRPLVCGVTGLSDEQRRRLQGASRLIPLLYDRNMSVGIAVLCELVARAAASLGPEFTAAIHEIHHVHKKDAPSGTALQLGEALARARHLDFESVCHIAADPETRRSPGEIVVTSERRGEVAGEHRVRLASAGESLELCHAVTDRRVFAAGALRAATWLRRQAPGLYAMGDVVRAARDGGSAAPVSVK